MRKGVPSQKQVRNKSETSQKQVSSSQALTQLVVGFNEYIRFPKIEPDDQKNEAWL